MIYLRFVQLIFKATWYLPERYSLQYVSERNLQNRCNAIKNQSHCVCFNSLAPGRFQFNFRYVNFNLSLVNGGWGISYEISLRWITLDLTDDKSPLVQVMAWCRQATSHYLSQCWPRSLSSNGVTRPQWVNKSLYRSYLWSIGPLLSAWYT